MINIKFNSQNDNYKNQFEILGARYGFKLSDSGIELILEKINEPYVEVSIKNNITIKYNNDNDLYRGLGKAIMALKSGKDNYHIKEKRQFKLNGLMVDCSRNGVINLSYAKELIEILSIMGHNTLLLYMEDVYKIDNEPYFGYLRGAYTEDELKEIDDYAHRFGIEVIPCIQTLAHLEEFLKWDGPREKYVDIDNILCVSTDETKELIHKMFKTLTKCFRSNKIHVGMDEAYNLGRGRYLDRFGLKSKSEIMNIHLNDILEIAKDYNIRPIIWDDMFFSRYSKAPEGELVIPEGIDLMYWDYYNNNKEHYISTINQRRTLERKVMFAGGAWRWIGYTPHHSKTLVSTNAALIACKEEGIDEVIVTSWSDDGCEAPLSPMLFGATLYAEHGYNYEVDKEMLDKALEFYTGMTYSDYLKQEEFDILPNMKEKANTTNISKYIFYEDPLLSLSMYHIEKVGINLYDYYNNLEKDFKIISSKYEKDSNNYIVSKLYSAYAKVLKYKSILSSNLYNSYHKEDIRELTNIKDNLIPNTISALEEFIKWRYKEWTYSNKRFGFEVLDIRVGAMIQRLKTTSKIIDMYLNNEIQSIEELEEERLALSSYKEEGMEETIHFNQSLKIMSPNKIKW